MASLKSLFPAGLVISQRVNSLYDLEQLVYGWNLNRTQLTQGDFFSHLDAFHTHNVQLGLTRRSMRIAINGEAPTDSITLVIILNDATLIQQKHVLNKNDLAILEHGGEVNAVFVEPISMINLSIHRDMFKTKYEQKFYKAYPVLTKFELRVCNAEILQTAKDELLRILDAVHTNRPLFLVPDNMNIIEKIIIDQMLNLVHTSSIKHKESKSIETAHNLFQLIQTKFDTDINIEVLCRELKVSQRNVYLTFQKHYRLTPNQYLLSLRLGNICNALKDADPRTASIEQIALSNGFYHMSHFAKIYKRFFGELPSQTLHKK